MWVCGVKAVETSGAAASGVGAQSGVKDLGPNC